MSAGAMPCGQDAHASRGLRATSYLLSCLGSRWGGLLGTTDHASVALFSVPWEMSSKGWAEGSGIFDVTGRVEPADP